MLALSVVMIRFDLFKAMEEVARLIAARFDKFVLAVLHAVAGVARPLPGDHGPQTRSDVPYHAGSFHFGARRGGKPECLAVSRGGRETWLTLGNGR